MRNVVGNGLSDFVERAIRAFLRFIGPGFMRGLDKAFVLRGIVGLGVLLAWHVATHSMNRLPIEVPSQSPFSDENRYPRSGLCPASLSRAGFAILCGPQGYLYSVEFLAPNPHDPDTADLAYLEANRPRILFALGIRCLLSALQAILARSTIFPRIGGYLR
jgi:hypothetical protein